MTDHKTVRLVILILGLTALALILVIGIGIYQEKELPDGVWTLAGGAVGALSSMLASTRGTTSSESGTVSVSVDAVADAEPTGT